MQAVFMGSGVRRDDDRIGTTRGQYWGQDAANGPRICLKIADDFAAKSADNDYDFRPRRPAGYFP
jgi:hypothetical protein